MAKNLYSLQLLRNGKVFTSYTEAVTEVQKGELADGVIKLARYTDASVDPYSGGTKGDVKTIFAIRHDGVDGKTGWTIFESYKEVIKAIKDKIDAMGGESGSIAQQIQDAINKLDWELQRDENKVVVSLKEVDGVISGSTADNLTSVKLGGYNVETDEKVAATDTLGQALGKLQAQINAMDKEASSGDGEVVITVVEADGKVTEQKEKISKVLLNDYAKDTTGTTKADKVAATDSLGTALSKLENQIEVVSANTKSQLDDLDYTLAKDDNKVVVSLNQTDGEISGESVNISSVKLDGYTVGGDDSGKVANTDTLGEALGKLQGQINGMDKAASVVDGQVVTTVIEADGKVTEDKANVKDLQLGGYSKDANATGDVASADTINTAISKLENNIAASKSATTVASADKSINVITAATGTDINVNIKGGEHVLAKDGNAGLYTNIALSSITPSSTTVKEEYQLTATDGTKLGDTIKIYKDSSISKIYLGYPDDTVDATSGVITSGTTGEAQSLNYVYHKEDGTYEMVHVDVSKFLAESEFKSGVTADNTGVVHGVVDAASEKDGQATPVPFLTVGENGFKVDGIKNEITRQINLLDVTGDTAQSGKYITHINETDGKIHIEGRADIAAAPLNGYEKGTAPADANSAITATDTINQALAKLEHQVDKAKAAATTKVEKDAAASHLTLTSSTAADGSVTYTIGESDIASKAALDAEIAARKAVDGQTGQTYAANSSSNFIKNAGSLNDADVKLDTELKKVEDEIGLVNSKYQAPASGYASGATTVSQAIAQLNEQAMKNTIVAGDGITVSEAAEGTTVAVKLRATTDSVENPLKFNNSGELYCDYLDCGTY